MQTKHQFILNGWCLKEIFQDMYQLTNMTNALTISEKHVL